jgi:hypothetical protein
MEAEAERKEMARASLPGHWMLTAGRHVPDWGGGGGSRGGPWVVRQVEGKRRRACGARWWPYPASSRGRAMPRLADVAPPLARRTSPRKLPRFRVGKETAGTKPLRNRTLTIASSPDRTASRLTDDVALSFSPLLGAGLVYRDGQQAC